MKQAFNQIHSFRWVLALALSAALFVGCNDAAKEEEKTAPVDVVAPATTDTMPSTDTMPKIDTTTVTKPDGGKTGPAEHAH